MDRYGHLLPVDRVGVGTRLDKLVFSNNEQIQSKNERKEAEMDCAI
ncbi:MAG: hypothetical protein ACUZ8H_11275 [Candidatus Anammoxibacter sp.]